VAIELEGENDNLRVGNLSLYSLEADEIVPTFRLGSSSDVGPIEIREAFGTSERESYYGFPTFVDEKIVFVNRTSSADQLTLIDASLGEKTRVLSSDARFSNVTLFQNPGVIVVNSGFSEDGRCFVIDKSLEVRRIGSGRCVATDRRLWLVSEDDSTTQIFELDESFEVIGRRSFPADSVVLSFSGRLGVLRTSGGLVEIHSIANGEVLWTSDKSDTASQTLTIASQADSMLIGVDADDEDGEIEVIWVRIVNGVLKSDSLGSARSVAGSLSSDGSIAVVQWTDPDDNARFEMWAMSESGSPRSQDLGNAENALFIEPNLVATVEDGTLYIADGNSAPRRAMDIYGEIVELSAVKGTNALYALTREDGDFTLTTLRRDGEKWRSTEVVPPSQELEIVDARGGQLLVIAVEDDAYGAIYILNVTEDGKARRIAEGNLRFASFGQDDHVYFAEVNGDSADIYRMKPGDRKSKTRVSSRYMIQQYGPRSTTPAQFLIGAEMTAVVDSLLAYCKQKGLPIINVGETLTSVAVPRLADGSPVACVRMRERGAETTVNVKSESSEDTAIQWVEYDLNENQTPENGGQVDRILSADDSGSSYNPTLNVSTGAGSALLRLYSWGEDATATLTVSSGRVATNSTEFDSSRYTADAKAREECRIHAIVDGMSPKRLKVGVYASGITGETPFCVQLRPGSSGPRTLVMNPIEIGDVAGLTVSCSENDYFFERTFRSDRPMVEDYDAGYVFPSSTKGLVGLCIFRHYRDYPADFGWGTWGEVDISLQQ